MYHNRITKLLEAHIYEAFVGIGDQIRSSSCIVDGIGKQKIQRHTVIFSKAISVADAVKADVLTGAESAHVAKKYIQNVITCFNKRREVGNGFSYGTKIRKI